MADETYTVTIADLDGTTIYRPDAVLAGRRYAEGVVHDHEVVGVGRVLSGPIVLVEADERLTGGEPVTLVSCCSCMAEEETDGRDDPAVAAFVRDHRCPDWLDVR